MFNKINNSECFTELWVVLSLLWLARKEFVGGGGCCGVSGLFSVKFNPQLVWREKKGRERKVQSRQAKVTK